MAVLSIIIPVLNEEVNIQKLLNHLKKRISIGDIETEVIVVDGGSSDQTKEIAKSNKFVKVIESERPGRSIQMNEGASQAQGEILFFLHVDSILPDNFISSIHKAIKTGSDYGCFRLSFDYDHTLLKVYSWFTKFSSVFIRFGDQGLFVRKLLFESIGGFREDLNVMEDQEIYFRLKKLGRFRLIDDDLITSARKYKIHGELKTQTVFLLIWLGYFLGIKQEILASFYSSVFRK